jgi:hypothetical protein
MTKTTKRTIEDYIASPDLQRETGKLQGYNEVMHWMNSFGVDENPEVYRVAKMMEMEFAINRNRSLTPIADEVGLRICAT